MKFRFVKIIFIKPLRFVKPMKILARTEAKGETMREIMAGSRTAVLFPLPRIFSALLEESTLSFWQTRGTAQGLRVLGQRYFSHFRVSVQCSSRTPLCHFDKLEGQREQPGDSRADIDIKRSLGTPLCHFDKLEAQWRAVWGQRKSLALKRSSRTLLSWIWVPAQLVDTPMVHRFKEYLRR